MVIALKVADPCGNRAELYGFLSRRRPNTQAKALNGTTNQRNLVGLLVEPSPSPCFHAIANRMYGTFPPLAKRSRLIGQVYGWLQRGIKNCRQSIDRRHRFHQPTD